MPNHAWPCFKPPGFLYYSVEKTAMIFAGSAREREAPSQTVR